MLVGNLARIHGNRADERIWRTLSTIDGIGETLINPSLGILRKRTLPITHINTIISS